MTIEENGTISKNVEAPLPSDTFQRTHTCTDRARTYVCARACVCVCVVSPMSPTYRGNITLDSLVSDLAHKYSEYFAKLQRPIEPASALLSVRPYAEIALCNFNRR